MNVLVLGGTGGSCRATLQPLLAQGHVVSAFVRGADAVSRSELRGDTVALSGHPS